MFTALSIVQPWAWLITRPDIVGKEAREEARSRGLFKDIENRAWSTPVRGWVLVHASSTKLSKWDYAEAALFAAARGIEVPLQGLPVRGAIVGAMRIDDCVNHSRSRWFMGSRGFVIGASVAFPEPVTCLGALSFFKVPKPDSGSAGDALYAAIIKQSEAAGIAFVRFR